ncbi:SusC/RagA family TonB-linked outer membrane protein [Arachidicoccus rhizosphaerae]|nr:SusC/RagA family TonB-linked outer membrane protein [Arachidicoccus rhizosphaerae]
MRFTIMSVMMLLFFVTYANNSKGQRVDEKNITVRFNHAPLKQVFKQLGTISGFNFAYKDADISQVPPVTYMALKESLARVLNDILATRHLNYMQNADNIVIVKRTDTVAPVYAVLVRRDTGMLSVNLNATVLNEQGQPIVGATVIAERFSRGNFSSRSQKTHAFTDNTGSFTMKLAKGRYNFTIVYVGYVQKTVEQDLKEDEAHFTVVITPTESSLEDVKISTGIFAKADKSFTGASTTVTREELQRFGNRNLITSLRNIDPAFNIVDNNSFGSDPNHLPEIQIRGNSSLPNVDQLQDQTRVALNTPLIILDGFESTLEKLLDINSNDVETITILKDASATAIYGSRGSNGVVVITTRAPKPGKLRVSYRADLTAELPDLSSYHLLNARDKLDLEYKAGYYNNARAESDLPLKRYYNYLLNQVNRGVNTDWMAIPLRNGIGQRHNIRMEGGDNSFRYSATVGYNDIEGVMKGSYRRTFNGTISLAYTYKNVRIKNNLMITQGSTRNSPYGSFGDYVQLNPYWAPYDSLGNVNKFLGDPGNYDYTGRWSSLPTNPLYNATLNGFDKTSTSEIINQTRLEWILFKNLTAAAQFGITKDVNQSDVFRSAENTAFANYSDVDIFRKGDYSYGITNALRYDGSINLSYTKVFASKHTLFAGMDYNVRQAQNSYYGFKAEGFSNPNFDFISMALQYAKGGKPSGSESLTRSVGLTGNINYIYDNRYFVDGSFRMDGSSQFGSDRKFAPFWSTGIGWNMHNENFLKSSSVVNRLKLRGSVGITGSQNFSSYQSLSTYQYYTDDRYFNWNGAYLLGLGNPDLQWQQATKFDVGTDAEFFNRRLSIRADYYIETTNNLVSSVNLPASNGFTSYIDNIGKLRNKGFEIQATYYILNNTEKGLTWSITGAAVQNLNKVLETSQALKDAQKSIQNATGNPGQLYMEGYSTTAIWVVKSLGIDPSTGKELYLTKDGASTYTWSGDDVVAVGNTEAKVFGNFSTFVRYKNLSVNVSFGYRLGGQQYNQTLIDRVETGSYKYNVDQRVYDDRWQKPGDIAAFKGLLVTTPTYKTSRFVQDENTLNCQNINVQYDIRSKSLYRKLGLEVLSITANMADPFYLSTVRRERGLDYPFSRMFSLTLNATF